MQAFTAVSKEDYEMRFSLSRVLSQNGLRIYTICSFVIYNRIW